MSLALGSSFARLNAGSASVKRMFRGSTGVWNADAADWIKRVEANSGSVSTATANAVTTFCNSVDAAGIRSKFYRLNLFCGTGLNACLVPLYRGPSLSGTQHGNVTDTNNGPFVSDDYVETGASGGLTGNGLSKYLDTGINQSFNGNVGHASVYHRGSVTLRAESLLRVSDIVDDVVGIDVTSANIRGFWGAALASQTGSASGHIAAARTSNTLLTLYGNGTSLGTQTASVSPTLSAVPFYVFASNQNGSAASWSAAQMQCYSLGDQMDGAEVAAFSTALIEFQTSLGRN